MFVGGGRGRDFDLSLCVRVLYCLMDGFFLKASLGVQCVALAGECAPATESLIFQEQRLSHQTCSLLSHACPAVSFTLLPPCTHETEGHECARDASVPRGFVADVAPPDGHAPSHTPCTGPDVMQVGPETLCVLDHQPGHLVGHTPRQTTSSCVLPRSSCIFPQSSSFEASLDPVRSS